MNSSKTLMFLSVITIIVVLTSACFITNCPPGGKRSDPSLREGHQRQCTRCGPSGIGRCFGPGICCGPSIGCQINNRYTEICSIENYSPVLCHNEGKTCANGKGSCAIDSTCCTSEGCFLDKHCKQNQLKAANEEKLWANSIDNSIF